MTWSLINVGCEASFTIFNISSSNSFEDGTLSNFYIDYTKAQCFKNIPIGLKLVEKNFS